MRHRSWYLILLFTLISSLASGQWESDQFLFDSKIKTSRPKPSRRDLTKEADTQKPLEIAESAKLANPNIEAVPSMEPTRIPASLGLPSVVMQARLGYVDFNSKSSSDIMNFSQGSYSLGVGIAFALSDQSHIKLNYLSSPDLTMGVIHPQGHRIKTRWEDMSIGYEREIQAFGRTMKAEPFLRQNAWWKTGSTDSASLEQLNEFGASLTLPLAVRGNWVPELKLQFVPFVKSTNAQLTGTSVSAEWSTFFRLKAQRAVILNIGYESLQLKENSDADFSFRQGMIKVFFGYQISTTK
jgi:hypothetical protein